MDKIAGWIIGIGLLGYGVFYVLEKYPFVLWVPVSIVVVGVIGYFLYDKLRQAEAETNISEGIPNGAPMKVNLRTEQLKNGKHRLYIDVKMSPDDWEGVKGTGLMNYWLFQQDGVTDLDNHYSVAHLLRVTHVDFPDIQSKDRAKAELIDALHVLRTRIDQFHEERIQERTPQGTKESYDI